MGSLAAAGRPLELGVARRVCSALRTSANIERVFRSLKLVVSSGFVAYSAAAAALAEVAFEPARPRGQPDVVRATPRARADLEVRRIRKRPTAGAMRRAAE